MPNETEAKIKVNDFAAIRKALRKARALWLNTVLETDKYFDTPGKDLLRRDTAVRLRATRRIRGERDMDVRPLLTFKGPGRKTSRLKVRKEVQTRLDSQDAVFEALAAVGVSPMLVIQKRREAWKLGRCQVLLDELPLIGRFVEIEGPDENTVVRAAHKLGLEGKPIKDHYIKLVMRRCARIGKKCTQITFEECDGCRRK